MTEEKHPSYGTIGISRVQGSRVLFGSPLGCHDRFMRLTIRDAYIEHKYSEDHIFPNKVLVEVDLSAAQFAELLTTMNVYSGVPCTINFVRGQGSIDPPPQRDLEYQKIKSGFVSKISEVNSRIDEGVKKAEQLIESRKGKSFRKSDVEEILSLLRMVQREVGANAPFMIDQFQEAAERVVTAAKKEVDNFVTHTMTTLGLDAMAKQIHSDEMIPKLIDVEEVEE